jgi:hypothetical protein
MGYIGRLSTIGLFFTGLDMGKRIINSLPRPHWWLIPPHTTNRSYQCYENNSGNKSSSRVHDLTPCNNEVQPNTNDQRINNLHYQPPFRKMSERKITSSITITLAGNGITKHSNIVNLLNLRVQETKNPTSSTNGITITVCTPSGQRLEPFPVDRADNIFLLFR